jgi:hypothetical protein
MDGTAIKALRTGAEVCSVRAPARACSRSSDRACRPVRTPARCPSPATSAKVRVAGRNQEKAEQPAVELVARGYRRGPRPATRRRCVAPTWSAPRPTHSSRSYGAVARPPTQVTSVGYSPNGRELDDATIVVALVMTSSFGRRRWRRCQPAPTTSPSRSRRAHHTRPCPRKDRRARGGNQAGTLLQRRDHALQVGRDRRTGRRSSHARLLSRARDRNWPAGRGLNADAPGGGPLPQPTTAPRRHTLRDDPLSRRRPVRTALPPSHVPSQESREPLTAESITPTEGRSSSLPPSVLWRDGRRPQPARRDLAAAYAATPERFVRRPPTPPALPTAPWINRPITPVDGTHVGPHEVRRACGTSCKAPPDPIRHNTAAPLFKQVDQPPLLLDERVDPRCLGVEKAGDSPLRVQDQVREWQVRYLLSVEVVLSVAAKVACKLRPQVIEPIADEPRTCSVGDRLEPEDRLVPARCGSENRRLPDACVHREQDGSWLSEREPSRSGTGLRDSAPRIRNDGLAGHVRDGCQWSPREVLHPLPSSTGHRPMACRSPLARQRA